MKRPVYKTETQTIEETDRLKNWNITYNLGIITDKFQFRTFVTL
jgi:hypothetical protein